MASASASTSTSKLWPRPQPRPRGFGLGLASISLSNYVIGHFSCKNRVKFGKFVNFSGNNLKSYVVNHYLVLFHNYFGFGLGLDLIVQASASASASRFWPRLTSLVILKSLGLGTVEISRKVEHKHTHCCWRN